MLGGACYLLLEKTLGALSLPASLRLSHLHAPSLLFLPLSDSSQPKGGSKTQGTTVLRREDPSDPHGCSGVPLGPASFPITLGVPDSPRRLLPGIWAGAGSQAFGLG